MFVEFFDDLRNCSARINEVVTEHVELNKEVLPTVLMDSISSLAWRRFKSGDHSLVQCISTALANFQDDPALNDLINLTFGDLVFHDTLPLSPNEKAAQVRHLPENLLELIGPTDWYQSIRECL